MAKKPTKPKKTVPEPARQEPKPVYTDAELKRLAERVSNTQANIYHVVNVLFPGRSFTDDDWARMEKQENIFRCDECNTFKDRSERCSWSEHICEECSQEIDGTGDE